MASGLVPEQHLVIMGSGGVGKTTLIVQVRSSLSVLHLAEACLCRSLVCTAEVPYRV